MIEESSGAMNERPMTPVVREIPEQPSNFKRNLTVGLWGTFLVILALFIGQNWRDTRINFLFWEFMLKLSFVLLAAAAIGLVLGFFIPIFWKRRRRN
jgi:uncharacterized integral membrane protein